MKKRVITIGTVCALAALCLAGASYAYLMDVDEHRTVFTVGNVSGTLTTQYDADTVETYPGEYIVAQPTISIDEGSEEAVAFLEIEVPVNKDVTMYDAAGLLDTSGQLFDVSRLQDDWIELNVRPKSKNDNNNVIVLGYQKRLNEDNPETGKAFNYLVTANFVEADALDDTEVVMTGDLLQAKGFGYDEYDTFQKGQLEEMYNQLNSQK